MGLVMLAWAAASTVGPLLAGGIADAAGDRAAFSVMIVLCAAIGTWLLVTADRGRERADADARQSAVDLDRLYGARDLDELRSEYDRIATAYDNELIDGMDYRSPAAVTAVARRLIPTDARVLDAGAGTGLLGVALAEAGFTRLDGVDLSPGMLAVAASKHVYVELREGRLGDDLGYESGAYDAVVSAGVLTTGHAPAASLDELVRITRPGGHLIFTLRSDQMPPGFDEKFAELDRGGRWALVERGEEFQALPAGEPEVLVRVWAFRVCQNP
jgi:SAM-dependent methyltransferase